MNARKFLRVSIIITLVVLTFLVIDTSHASYDDTEFIKALARMYDNGLTKSDSTQKYNPGGLLTREQFAKFASMFAVENQCLRPDETIVCDFSDIPEDPTLDEYILLACQLGLVKGKNGKYLPTAPISKAEVLTILDRINALAHNETPASERVTPRRKGHFEAMRNRKVTKERNVYALDADVTRYEVALMLYRLRVGNPECGEQHRLGEFLEQALALQERNRERIRDNEGDSEPDRDRDRDRERLRLTEQEAHMIAVQNCIQTGESLGSGYYNDYTHTWRFDATLKNTPAGCNPACVVSEDTSTAEINRRCTGLIDPSAMLEDTLIDLFTTKYPTYKETISVVINQKSGNHARGSVIFEQGAPGGNFLATDINGNREIVFDGNGAIPCSLSSYKFPKAMLADCAE